MNKILIGMLLTCLLLVSNVFGRTSKDFSILVKAGGHFPVNSYKVGVELESGIRSSFALQYGLTYSSFFDASVTGGSFGRLAIPLWFKFRFYQNRPFGFYVGPGVSLNLITASAGAAATIREFNVGVGGLIGIQYYFNNIIKIFLDVDVSFYVINFGYEVSIVPGIGFTFGRKR